MRRLRAMVPNLWSAYLQGLGKIIHWGWAENTEALTFKILLFILLLVYFCGMF